jgi:2-polyprenyl-3-methyl-5-hydroxy-6-metoxy-1,4-benzoquinol methylase
MPSHEDFPCWCGETRGPAIGRDYRRCARCGTAVVSILPAGLHGDPRRDDGLYGKRYWLEYQREHGLPDVRERARADLSERCVFWLERLLEAVRPPGRALEIGAGHGAFVSLLRELGFDAVGMDLSPWVVEFARATFGAPVRPGTLETVDLEPGFTCIAAFDVLEHLVDPLDTMRRCARLLAPDGVLLLQTPCYRGEGPHWAMFQPDEHVYLFSEASVRELLGRAGFRDLEIRPSLFPYDMWVAATPGTLTHHSPWDDVGLGGWRLPASFRSLLDLNAQAHALRRSLTEANTDRAERLRQVEELTEVARKADAERINQVDALLAQIEELTAIARNAEAGRLAQAEALTAQIAELSAVVHRVEADRLVEVGELTRQLEESEADRAARLEVIRGAEVQILTLRAEIETLRRRLDEIERTRAGEP